jgi:MFS family permease
VPPLVGFLDRRSHDFPSILLYTAFVMFIPLLLLFFLQTSRVGANQNNYATQGINIGELKEDLKNRNVLVLLAVNLLLYTCYTVVFFFLKGFGESIGIRNSGFFFTIATITMIIIRLTCGTLFDRINKVQVTAFSLTGLGLCNIGLAHTHGAGLFFFLSVLFGIGWGIVMPILTALMFDISPTRFRGLNINLSLVMLQAGFFLGPFFGGLILTHSGYVTLFYYCALLSILSAIFTRRVTVEQHYTGRSL